MGEAQGTLGLFSAPPSINVGSPYKTDNPNASDRLRGRQFTTQPPKRGKAADVTFSKFETLAVGDPYVEMAIQERRDRNKLKAAQIVAVPFRPANPSGKSTGHGSYFGTFGIWANVKTTDAYDKRPMKRGELILAQKNIVTSPSKKGTYGMIGTNIGGEGKGINGEYEYLPDPVKGRPQTAPADAFKPFVPSSPAKKGTYGCTQLHVNGGLVPHGFAGEYKYQADPVQPRSANDQQEALKPFRPSHPAKSGKGFYGTFRWSGQEYVEDPEKAKWDKMMAEKKETREKGMGVVFRPTTGAKSMRVTSIANHPLMSEVRPRLGGERPRRPRHGATVGS
ncbi:hypothetical protein T484DRAFT_2548914 [Baffinella frigidus]|nr:hypothetical protein T484DRAFT_2548914 [Cryptophyta sp. CCMP2293]